MTLSQLRSFVTVARLGSVKAASRALGVSEPAVSIAVAALRREIGDRLYARGGEGIVLTPGGRRLARIATEMLGLADQAHRTVGAEGEEPVTLRVVATGVVAEYGGEALIDAFAAKSSNLEVTLEEEPGARFAELLEQRHADLALGPAPRPSSAIHSVPCLRCRAVVVAAPGHRLAGRRRVRAAELSGERWLVGPAGIDTATAPGRQLERHLGPAAGEAVRPYRSERAAVAAVAAGEGIMLAVSHAIAAQLRSRTLVVLDVRGTPLVDLWHASALGPAGAIPAARALQRFATTPEAMQAMFGGRGWSPATRFRPPVHVTLWRYAGEEVRGKR
ncbi:MAG: LysR family transcriptional regulator [Solirubrobacterales bacterium]